MSITRDNRYTAGTGAVSVQTRLYHAVAQAMMEMSRGASK